VAQPSIAFNGFRNSCERRRQKFVLDLVTAFGFGARRTFAGQQPFAVGHIGGNGDARPVTVFGHDAPLDIGDAAIGPHDRHGAFPSAAVRQSVVKRLA
jgi:hypothetical protein